MKKRYLFLLALFLFIAYAVLYYTLVPKVIFINKSGYDLDIFGYYINDHEALRKKHPENEPLKFHYSLLGSNKKISYNLGLFSNKGKVSSFSAYWSLPIKINGIKIQNRMKLPPENFGWKNVTFIIDENGNYHKLDNNTK